MPLYGITTEERDRRDRLAQQREEQERRTAAREADLQAWREQTRWGYSAVARPSAPSALSTMAQANAPEAWRIEWETSPALRAEFPSADHYVALRKAEGRGVVKGLFR